MDSGHSCCSMCSQNCRRIHGNSRASFPGFALVVKADCLDEDFLRLPSQFADCAREMLDEAWATQHGYFYLEGPSRIRWPVATCRVRGELQQGWRSFAKDNTLQLGDVIIFKIVESLVLAVSIFDCQGNEKTIFGGSNPSVRREACDVVGNSKEEPSELPPPEGRETRDVERGPVKPEDWSEWEEYLEPPPAQVPYAVKQETEVIDLDQVPDCRATTPPGAKRVLNMESVYRRDFGTRKSQPSAEPAVSGVVEEVSQGQRRKEVSAKRTLPDAGELRKRVRRMDRSKAFGGRTSKDPWMRTTETARRVARSKQELPKRLLYSNRRDVTPHEIRQTLNRAKAKAQAQAYTHPTCFISMTKSHVLRGFWLGLPATFCLHMGQTNQSGCLVDGRGRRHSVKYIIEGRNSPSGGLSAGWRGFAMSRTLDLHDVCVFELVDSSKFEMKVHIFRVVDVDDTDLTCKHSSSSERRPFI